jgi:drug/metabolite transporter (DMT)-like permease
VSIVLALLSSFLWGSADFYGGVLSKRLSPYAVVGASQACGFVAITAVVLIGGRFDGSTDWVGWALMAGCTGAAGLVLFYAALASGTMGVVSPIAALGAIVPVIVALIQGETPSALGFVGMAVALAGAVLASGPELRGETGARSVLLAAGAGVCFGLALTALAYGARKDPILALWGMRLTSLVIFAVVALAARSLGGLTWSDLPKVTVIGLGDTGANLLFGIAATMGMVSLTSVAGSLYPVATVILAWLVLNERMLKIQVLGVVLALVGITMVSAG